MPVVLRVNGYRFWFYEADLDEVRVPARNTHARGECWDGEAFGWSAEYHPEKAEPPLDSKMTFTPTDFCIGESGIWFFSMMWEHGHDKEPVKFLDDKNIIPAKQLAGIVLAEETLVIGDLNDLYRRVWIAHCIGDGICICRDRHRFGRNKLRDCGFLGLSHRGWRAIVLCSNGISF